MKIIRGKLYLQLLLIEYIYRTTEKRLMQDVIKLRKQMHVYAVLSRTGDEPLSHNPRQL